MAETISLMDIDDDKIHTKPNKGKNVILSSSNPEPKSVPWVEKFRPQSLSDVAAHRDIVETSTFLLSLHFSLLLVTCTFLRVGLANLESFELDSNISKYILKVGQSSR